MDHQFFSKIKRFVGSSDIWRIYTKAFQLELFKTTGIIIFYFYY